MRTKAELLTKLKELNLDCKVSFMEGFCPFSGEDLQVYSYNAVEEYGGEDQGQSYYAVWEFQCEDGPIYIKFHGWYSSYDGVTYEGLTEVFPREVTRIEYF